jgi:nitrite reductase/ring-hydroxylating ferredoxin subunit
LTLSFAFGKRQRIFATPKIPDHSMTDAPTRLELCKTDDVAVGEALKVEKDDLALAVFNVDGEFYVTDDACTHGPGSLSEGYIEGDVVECNFHNGAFNIRTGEVVLPPCMVPVKTYKTVVEDGTVFIERP